MKPFRAPNDSLGTLDAATAATLVAQSSDLALILDSEGIIQDVAVQPSDLSLELEGYGYWLGRPWSDTVAAESRPKVESMLIEAAKSPASSWRQLIHKSVGGRDVPILYSVVKVASADRIVALGRDLRSIAALQQRLIDAQMSMERDYAKLRSAETRYRMLFQASSEPVLIVDGHSHRVLEANPAAAAMLEAGAKRVVGRQFAELFPAADRSRVQHFLGELRGPQRTDDIALALADGGAVQASAVLFRQDAATLLLVRLLKTKAVDSLEDANQSPSKRPSKRSEDKLKEFVLASPDAYVVADAGGRVVAANPAFAELAQASDPGLIAGSSLESWFGRPGVDLDLAIMNLRQHGSLRLFTTYVRGSQGAHVDVEVSAVALGQGKDATYGFSIRDVGRRLAPAARPAQDLPHSAAQLTELIGRVPLKDLVRETTDVIEKLCIEAALELTGDNRASAAEVLGLSRQSLYVKLRRFGLAEAGVEDEV